MSGKWKSEKFVHWHVHVAWHIITALSFGIISGDMELSNFLKEEIQLEKDGKQAPEQIPGFTLSTDGATATLTKTKDGET